MAKYSVMIQEIEKDPFAALLKERQTGRGQRTANREIRDQHRESSQVTGRRSGQAARDNNPKAIQVKTGSKQAEVR